MELVRRASEASIGVIGDLILDRYTWGDVSRISPEAPVPVIHAKTTSDRLGGAGNAAQNLTALEVGVTVFGRLGNDPAGQTVRALLNDRGIDQVELPRLPDYSTTVKTRYIAEAQHLLRVDDEVRRPIDPNRLEDIDDQVREAIEGLDALLLSDYGKGVFSRETVGYWIELARELGIPVVVDPVIGHFEQYERATLVTPNDRELTDGLSRGPEDTRDLLTRARDGVEELNLEALLVTRGEEGMTLVPASGESVHRDTEAREVYDVTGAGDTVAAVMTVGEALGLDRTESMRVANAAAGQVVGRMGTAVIERETLNKDLDG